jgi:hypothetical protein
MNGHPMFLEYDWTSDTYRSHLGGAFASIEHSFETLAAARRDLRLIGLRIGAKTDMCTWRIEFIEPVAERADFFRLGSWRERTSSGCTCRCVGRSNGTTTSDAGPGS